jgi:hypothetical protein
VRNVVISASLLGAVALAIILPSSGKCVKTLEGGCGAGSCPVGTDHFDASNCNCSGVSAKACGCGGKTKCYNSVGALIATVDCTGTCYWKER